MGWKSVLRSRGITDYHQIDDDDTGDGFSNLRRHLGAESSMDFIICRAG